MDRSDRALGQNARLHKCLLVVLSGTTEREKIVRCWLGALALSLYVVFSSLFTSTMR